MSSEFVIGQTYPRRDGDSAKLVHVWQNGKLQWVSVDVLYEDWVTYPDGRVHSSKIPCTMDVFLTTDCVVKEDYKEFWRRYPDQKNPTDINTREKHDYSNEIGWERFNNMQKARKLGRSFTIRGDDE